LFTHPYVVKNSNDFVLWSRKGKILNNEADVFCKTKHTVTTGFQKEEKIQH